MSGERASSQPVSYEDFKNILLGQLELLPTLNNPDKSVILIFGKSTLKKPLGTEESHIEEKTSFSRPFNIETTLTVRKTGEVKQMGIYLGSIPVLTDKGHFIIDGEEFTPNNSAGTIFTEALKKGLKKMVETATRRLCSEYDTDYIWPAQFVSYKPVETALKRAAIKAVNADVK